LTESQYQPESQLAETLDATLLQRRARRRLVGAIALVVLVVIVLPIVLDSEPSPVGRDLIIEIPGQDAGRFNSRVRPRAVPEAGEDAGAASAPATAPAKPQQPSVTTNASSASEPAKKAATNSKKEHKAAAGADAEAARAKALLEGKDMWVISLGAYANQANVKHLRDKLAAAGVQSYTEAVTGPKGEPTTRVRAGPFDSKRKAEQAQKKIAAAGIPPGTVGQR